MYEDYFEKKKISVDDFYRKVLKISWNMFDFMNNIPHINLGDNVWYHRKLRAEWRKWIIEELHYQYEIEV
jgi:hypothetical protein